MCLAIPMRVIAVDGFNATCEAKAVRRDVSLFLMQDVPVAVGDLVMVHVGYAIQKVSEEDAAESWALLDEVLEKSSAAAAPPLSLQPSSAQLKRSGRDA